MTPLGRTILFVPGNVRRFIDNAPGSGAHVICLDLEDGVAPRDKAAAREMVREALPRIARPGQYLLFVRVNDLDTGLLEEDLLAVVSPHLDGVSLPKAHTPQVVQQVDHYLTLLEAERGLRRGAVRLAPWIESAEGALRALEVCRASPRLVAASFGSEDFANDLGVRRTPEGKEVEWAHYAVATACAAARIAALAGPTMDYRDMERLERDARFARGTGYQGKFCIHPAQVPIVNRVFQPTEEEVAEARRIVAAYEEAESQGRGAIGLDGMVVDRPIYVRAQALLASVKAVAPAAEEA